MIRVRPLLRALAITVGIYVGGVIAFATVGAALVFGVGAFLARLDR